MRCFYQSFFDFREEGGAHLIFGLFVELETKDLINSRETWPMQGAEYLFDHFRVVSRYDAHYELLTKDILISFDHLYNLKHHISDHPST